MVFFSIFGTSGLRGNKTEWFLESANTKRCKATEPRTATRSLFLNAGMKGHPQEQVTADGTFILPPKL
jgi:hypothetical protein